MVRRICLAAILIVAAVLLLGCQTVQGLGQDIQWIGEATTNAAGGL